MLQKNYSNLLLSFFILIFGLFQYLHAQGPDTLWTKTFGGTDYDYGYSVQQTLDGGYIIAGCINCFGPIEGDVWLIKTDDSGDSLWTKTYGVSGYDYAYTVQQTTDEGYIMTGMTQSFGANEYDLWLLKTDASGDTLWTKTFGGGDIDAGNCVRQTSDGGYIITGYTYYLGTDLWLLKTNASGDTAWTKTFGGSDIDNGISVQQTADGGYIITGSTKSFGAGEDDLWLIKTNASGGTVWTKTFGGSAADRGTSVQQTADGGYIITGGTESFGAGGQDVWLIKTNASGDTTWTKTFGGNAADWGISVQQTADGGYIITGMAESFDVGAGDVWLIKTNASGDTLWTKTFGGSDIDYAYSVQQTTDGGFIITGVTESFGAGAGDVWLIKTDADPSDVIQDEQTTIPSTFILNQNYPNPFNPSTNIKFSLPIISNVTLKIYDVLGNEIVELVNGRMEAGIHEFHFNSLSLTSGVYFYKLEAQEVNSKINFVDVGKMMLVK